MARTYRHQDSNALRRFLRRSAAWAPVSWVYARALQRIDGYVYRATGGRALLSSLLSGLPVVLLTTRGARTGAERTVPVLGIPDGDSLLVIASNYGQRHSPAWAINLRAHPVARVRLEGAEREVVARELAGADRDDAYRRSVGVYPGFIAYRDRAAPRVIPVFRLRLGRLEAQGRAGAEAATPSWRPAR